MVLGYRLTLYENRIAFQKSPIHPHFRLRANQNQSERGSMNYDRLKAYMKQHRISVSALEKLCGLSNATIRKWNPEVKGATPNLQTLQIVSEKTGIPIEELL